MKGPCDKWNTYRRFFKYKAATLLFVWATSNSVVIQNIGSPSFDHPT